jgi:hypothetical protein
MLPIVGVPETIRQGLAPYREVFCREAGFAHIGRYITGLILSPHGVPCMRQSLKRDGLQIGLCLITAR